MLAAAQRFLADFFDQNPLSHVGLLVLRNSKCEKLTELSGDKAKHVGCPKPWLIVVRGAR